MKKFLVAVCLWLAWLGAVMAGPVDDAAAHIKAKRYNEARALLEPLAQRGDAMAMGHLARLYSRGWGVTEDKDRAMQLARAAADGGSPEGANILGLAALDAGRNEEGLRYLRKAADQGYARAQVNLGYWYRDVKRNYSEAALWFRKAAEANDAGGMAELASTYAAKESGFRDLNTAVTWMRKAAALGEEGAIRDLPGLEAEFTREVNEGLSARQRAEAERAAEKAKVRSGKFATSKTNIAAQTYTKQLGALTLTMLRITSKDDEAFVLERVVMNNRENNAKCDFTDLAILMRTGDTRDFPLDLPCGNTLVRVSVETNRGAFKFGF